MTAEPGAEDLPDALDAVRDGFGVDAEVLAVTTNNQPPDIPPGWRWDWRPVPFGTCQRCPWPVHTRGPDGRPWHPFCWVEPDRPVPANDDEAHRHWRREQRRRKR